jgi:hypothetical protein
VRPSPSASIRAEAQVGHAGLGLGAAGDGARIVLMQDEGRRAMQRWCSSSHSSQRIGPEDHCSSSKKGTGYERAPASPAEYR